MADSSDDEFGAYDAAEGSRYPVHDCVELEDAESLRVSSGVRLWRPGGGGASAASIEVQVERMVLPKGLIWRETGPFSYGHVMFS